MLNRVSLLGRVGQNPEIRQNQNGKKIVNFSLATSEKWKDKNTGEVKENTQWHKIAIFQEGLANIAEKYVKKGSKLYIEGSLETHKWTDKDGKDNYTTQVILKGFNSTLLLLREKGHQVDNHNKAKADGYQPQNDEVDDEIPF